MFLVFNFGVYYFIMALFALYMGFNLLDTIIAISDVLLVKLIWFYWGSGFVESIYFILVIGQL